MQEVVNQYFLNLGINHFKKGQQRMTVDIDIHITSTMENSVTLCNKK